MSSKKKSVRSKKGSKAASSAIAGNATPVDALISQAEDELSEMKIEEAIATLEQVLSRDNNHLAALDLYGQALLESGQSDRALEVFKRSCNLSPDVGFAKWMNMGQLLAGHDALKCYQKGINLMLQESKETGNDLLAREISSAYTSMAELYTTDCCDDDDAEAQVERLLQQAISTCAANPEPYQQLANLRLIRARMDEAKAAIEQCVRLTNACSDEDAPSFEFKTKTANLALEIGHYKLAATLFEEIVEEDDRFAENWYMAGLCNFHLKHFTSALVFLERAKMLNAKAFDPELMDAIAEASESCQKALAAGEEAEEEEEDDEDEDEELDGDDEDEDMSSA